MHSELYNPLLVSPRDNGVKPLSRTVEMTFAIYSISYSSAFDVQSNISKLAWRSGGPISALHYVNSCEHQVAYLGQYWQDWITSASSQVLTSL